MLRAKNVASVLLLLLLIPFSQLTIAGQADLSGAYSITFPSDTQVTMKVGRIANNTPNYITGTLYLSLRYTAGSSPFGSGYTAARVSLGTVTTSNGVLNPNHYWQDLSVTTDFTRPPPGTYYVHLIISEYPNLNTAVDYLTFSSTSTISGVGSGSGAGGGNNLHIVGNVAYSISNGEAEIRIDRIENRSTTVTTGTLYATLWFTAGPDPIGSGYEGARQGLHFLGDNGTMTPNTYVTGVSFTTDFTPPPDGSYYVHLYLSQYPDLDTVLDSVTFSQRFESGVGVSVPAPPAIQSVSQGSSYDLVRLSWGQVTAATSYKIYRSSQSGALGSVIKTTSSTSYDDYSGSAGTSYFYSVKACNSAGCSAASGQVEGWRAVQSAPNPGGEIVAYADDVWAIARLYSASFDRLPKDGGLNFWVNSFQQGQNIVQIAAEFVNSNEFRLRYGSLTNSGYVRQLFLNVLGREVAASGLSFWVGHLNNGVSRAEVLKQISASAENVSKTSHWLLSGTPGSTWSVWAPY